jgi:hypothetical protein
MRAALFGLIAGALAAGNAIIAMFFLKFWRRTHDRLFVMFAMAFTLLAIQRVAAVITFEWTASDARHYVMRLIAFLLILAAIVDKNRPRRRD